MITKPASKIDKQVKSELECLAITINIPFFHEHGVFETKDDIMRQIDNKKRHNAYLERCNKEMIELLGKVGYNFDNNHGSSKCPITNSSYEEKSTLLVKGLMLIQCSECQQYITYSTR